MDLDDSLSMSMFELDKGISTIMQTEEFFDCYPAVKAAFGYTKAYFKQGEEVEEAEDEKVEEGQDEEEESLEYREFGIFLHALKQYYQFCKVYLVFNILLQIFALGKGVPK